MSNMSILWAACRLGLKSSRKAFDLKKSEKICTRTMKTVNMAFTSFESNETDRRSPTIIIMHGLLGSKHNWREISQGLEKKLHRKVYTVDARNHGDSPYVSEHSSAHMAADIAELMRIEGFSRATLIGHSMGGRTMMFFALKYPHLVERTIVVDVSPMTFPKELSGTQQIFLAMKNISLPPHISIAKARLIAAQQIRKVVRDHKMVDLIILHLRKRRMGEFSWTLNIDALHRNLRHFSNFPKEIERMKPFYGPVMFICGRKSNFVDPRHWPHIQRIFPNSEMHWMDAGHWLHLEKPTEFISLVTEFLKR